MNFRTEIKIEKSNSIELNHTRKIFLIGSCFTENIGGKLANYFFNTLMNPFGITYNPLSISAILRRILANENFEDSDLFYHNELWNSFMHHSRFSEPDKFVALEKINKSLQDANKFIQEADVLVISFGTAWIYQKSEDGELVNNCHKLPSRDFVRRRLSVTEIVKDYSDLVSVLHELNPNLKILFTVSPVRHLKDGFHENQISKSILMLAVEELLRSELCHYFPSYEIVMDDLRDYRFYASDYSHPSDEAVDYIWSKFVEMYMDDSTTRSLPIIEKLYKAMNHRLFNPESESTIKFRKANIRLVEKIESEVKGIDLEKARQHFE
jgi:hypothetical protein